MQYIKLFFNILKYLSFALLFAVASWVMLSHFGYVKTLKPYIVQSGSMEPAIPTGSVIFTLQSDLYQPGDIITFFVNGDPKTVVTHRLNFKIFQEEHTKYLTSGDANEDFDRWELRHEHIVGKVIAIIPYAGYAIEFAKTPKGFIALVVVPATIVIYEELKSLIREIVKYLLLIKIYLFKKLKRREDIENAYTQAPKHIIDLNFKNVFIFVPIFGVFAFITTTSAGYFFDTEKSQENVIGVATSYISPTTTVSPSTTPTIAPIVRLNEAAPAVNPEWVEIYNDHTSEADFLRNYWLDDDIDFTNDSGNSPKILMSSIDTSNISYPTIDLNSPIFNNTGDFIVLFDQAGNLVDSVSYTKNPGAKSIGREIDGIGAWKFPCLNSTKGSSNNNQC